MTSVLITAFDGYDRWHSNASWLGLIEFAKSLPAAPQITTRLYPVDFEQVKQRLADDLAGEFDVALHLGQAPGAGRIHLESIGVNVAGHSHLSPDQFGTLIDGGPVAYRTTLPLHDWAGRLRAAGIPAQVSYHAGTYLCNATMYLSHHLARQMDLKTQAAFIHVPLAMSQVIAGRDDLPFLPSAAVARALHLIAEQL